MEDNKLEKIEYKNTFNDELSFSFYSILKNEDADPAIVKYKQGENDYTLITVADGLGGSGAEKVSISESDLINYKNEILRINDDFIKLNESNCFKTEFQDVSNELSYFNKLVSDILPNETYTNALLASRIVIFRYIYYMINNNLDLSNQLDKQKIIDFVKSGIINVKEKLNITKKIELFSILPTTLVSIRYNETNNTIDVIWAGDSRAYILTKNGFFSNIWFLSLKSYTCVLSIVSSNLLINNNFIVIYLPLSILITTFILFFIFLILNHYGILFEFNSKASIASSFGSPVFYLSLFLLLGLSIVIDYSFKLFNIFFNNSLSSRIILNRYLKRKSKIRNSELLINNISSKSYSNCNPNSSSNSNNKNNDSNKNNNNKNKIKISDENQEVSNNYLITKTPHYILNKIIRNNIDERNPYKNDSFQLKFRNVNQIFNYNQKSKKDNV